MSNIKVYLQFDGECHEAFEFYKSVLGGEFGEINRYGEAPKQEHVTISEEDNDKIMHMSLSTPDGTVLYGSDFLEDENNTFEVGNNISLYLNVPTNEKADEVFKALSEHGVEKMAMNQTFWGTYFGLVTDQYGINWMIACEPQEQTQAA